MRLLSSYNSLQAGWKQLPTLLCCLTSFLIYNNHSSCLLWFESWVPNLPFLYSFAPRFPFYASSAQDIVSDMCSISWDLHPLLLFLSSRVLQNISLFVSFSTQLIQSIHLWYHATKLQVCLLYTSRCV